MTTASEIERLQTAKASIKTAIENKGITIPNETKLDGYASYINNIPTGNPYNGTLMMRCWLTRGLGSGYRSGISCRTSFAVGDYIFWVVAGASYNSSYDEYHINFFALKNGWTNYKRVSVTTTTADDWYHGDAGYTVDGNTLKVYCNTTNSKSASYRYVANFDLETGARGSTGQSSDAFVAHGNDIFADCAFDPDVYNFYGTEEPLVVLNRKTS